MKTKEEIRHQNNIYLTEEELFDENDIYNAMDEYAKQESVLFFAFKHEYQTIERLNIQIEYNKIGGIFSWVGASDDIIWDAYKNNKQLERINPK